MPGRGVAFLVAALLVCAVSADYSVVDEGLTPTGMVLTFSVLSVL